MSQDLARVVSSFRVRPSEVGGERTTEFAAFHGGTINGRCVQVDLGTCFTQWTRRDVEAAVKILQGFLNDLPGEPRKVADILPAALELEAPRRSPAEIVEALTDEDFITASLWDSGRSLLIDDIIPMGQLGRLIDRLQELRAAVEAGQ